MKEQQGKVGRSENIINPNTPTTLNQPVEGRKIKNIRW